MIFYFSGTGNSKYVAEQISVMTNDRYLVPFSTSVLLPKRIKEDEKIGFVFPVYCWGPPKFMTTILNLIRIKGYKSNYTYAIITMGDDSGKCYDILSRILKRKNIKLNAAYTIQMPNTYVCLPGFDVDPEKIVEEKLFKAKERIKYIAERISQKKCEKDVIEGNFAWIKSYIIRPLFNTLLINDKYFHTNSQCTKCNLCIKSCPLSNIRMTEKGPKWIGLCTGCLKCYHRCPNKSIEFLNQTKGKGQYMMHFRERIIR